MKIVILDGYALNPGDLSYESLRQFGELTIYDRTDTEDEAIARIADSEIVLVNKLPVTERLLDACPSIRLICVQATGYNTVDCAACARRGIPVTNVPTYGTAAVAQFTFALMLELCHRVGHHDVLVHAGRWESCGSFCFWDTPQMELAGEDAGHCRLRAHWSGRGEHCPRLWHECSFLQPHPPSRRGRAGEVCRSGHPARPVGFCLPPLPPHPGDSEADKRRHPRENEGGRHPHQHLPGRSRGRSGGKSRAGKRPSPRRRCGRSIRRTHHGGQSPSDRTQLHHHAPHGMGRRWKAASGFWTALWKTSAVFWKESPRTW